MTPEALATIGLALFVTGMAGVAMRHVLYGPIISKRDEYRARVARKRRQKRKWSHWQRMADECTEALPQWAR